MGGVVIMTCLAVKHLLRAWGGVIVAAVLGESVVVAGVVWYLVEFTWGSAPLSASRTPLHPATFTGGWLAAFIGSLTLAPLFGAAAMRGPWVGSDPTRALPIGHGSRLLVAWIAAAIAAAVVGVAPIPVYVALYEMGAFAPHEVGGPLGVSVTSIVVGPGIGILAGIALRHRAARRRGARHVRW